jgi:asparagine synthase (glutamine-hydrolysing)
VGLGHRRLSIIDLSEYGKQPMSLDDSLFVVFNGEIYNYLELKSALENEGVIFQSKSDTEVILQLYKKYGKECLNKLRGMFAFSIYDKKKNTLFCARDRFGIKPFYYYQDSNKFVFASEIKGIFCDASIVKEPNDKMIYDFLMFNRTDHTEQTCFLNIYNLRPGHYIWIESNMLTITKWYEPPTLVESNLSEEEQIKRFKNKLEESVTLHLRSDVPVGAELSGGMDSSSIVCLMKQQLGQNAAISTFSAVFDEKWIKDERKYIQAVVEKTQVKSFYTTPTVQNLMRNLRNFIYHQEEPVPDISVYIAFSVLHLIKEHNVKVVLNGQGADELLGYEYMAAFYFYELLRSKKFLILMRELRAFALTQKFNVFFSLKVFAFLLLPGFLKDRAVKLSNPIISPAFEREYHSHSKFTEHFMSAKSLNESVVLHLLHKLTHLLRYEDKNSMAHSIETRVPYLDHELVEETVNVSSSLKIRNGRLKHILRESMKDLLPSVVIDRNNKIGYEAPDSLWFKDKDFMHLLHETFSSKTFLSRKYYDHQKVLELLEQQKSGKKDYTRVLWKVFCLEMWFKVFFEEDAKK